MTVLLEMEEVKKRLQIKRPGWVLDDTVYRGNRYNMTFYCDKGHRVIATWGNMNNGMGCRICSGLNGPKIEEVRSLLYKKNPKYTLISKEYISARSRLHIKCDMGHDWMITWGNLKKHNTCGMCCQKKRFERAGKTLQQELDEVRPGWKLKEGQTYNGRKNKMVFICDKNHPEFKGGVSSVLSKDTACPTCYKESVLKRTTKIEQIQKYTEKYATGYVLLSKEYIPGKKILLNCNKKHEVSISWFDFKNNVRCKMCRIDEHRLNIDYVRKEGNKIEPGYDLISTEYIDCKTKMNWLCKHPDKHVARLSWNDFKTGVRCSKCQNYKTQERCRDIFEDIFKKEFQKDRPPWLINPKTGKRLELDGYNEELNLAFEYDGPQHFHPTKWSGSESSPEKNFRYQKYKDKVKDQSCKENNITLIRIPYTEKKKLDDFIVKKLTELGYNVN